MQFNSEDAVNIAEFLEARVPVSNARLSTLGGNERASIMILVVAEPRESWANGILENSRYARFHLTSDGKLELFSGSLYREVKFRKATVKNIEDAKQKLGKYISAVFAAK